MKKLTTTIISFLSLGIAFAQPVLRSDSLHTGPSFNLYSLGNVNTANLTPSGSNVTWDISTSTSTLIGTADLLPMSATTYGSTFSAANFAMKFTANGVTQYSLFTVTTSKMEEVANNIGTANQTSFASPRTTLVFPFTFNLSDSDVYQKSGQGMKYITNKYDAYGTLITPFGTYNNVVRIMINDFGTTSLGFWNTSPFFPIMQADGSGVALWKRVTTNTGIEETRKNNSFEIFPNPTTNELSILSNEIVQKVDIYSVSGKLQISTSQTKIDVSELSQGIYFVKVYSQNGDAMQKFVKQ
jgi:Secretion system C-terminal sorting domain